MSWGSSSSAVHSSSSPQQQPTTPSLLHLRRRRRSWPPDSPSVDYGAFGTLELELGTVDGFEIDDDAAAFAPAALRALFKNRLGKLSSSAKSYSGAKGGSLVLGLAVPWQRQQPRRGWSC